MEVTEGHRVDQLRRIPDPVRSQPIEGGGRVGYDAAVETEICRHACRRRDAVVGRQSDDDQGLVSGGPQLRLEGGPDEAAMDTLLEDALAWCWCRFDLEL